MQTKSFLLCFLFALSLAFVNSSHATETARYGGHYFCVQGRTALDLALQIQDEAIQATFMFVTASGIKGSFRMRGSFDKATHAITLKASDWIERPGSFVTVDLDGKFSSDLSTLTGRVRSPGCSTFSVTRSAQPDSETLAKARATAASNQQVTEAPAAPNKSFPSSSTSGAATAGATSTALGAFSPVASATVDGSRLTLLRAIDLQDRRINGDGNLFFRTAYRVSVDDGKSSTEKILETDLYTPEDLSYNGDGMRPSFLIDPVAKVITVFASGKGPDNRDYSMVGVAYRLDSNKEWSREVVFDRGNHGWYSYFGGSLNGNPELWHFSYAGYRQLRSYRTGPGRWQTEEVRSIQPAAAVAELRSKRNVLVSTVWGDQRPAGGSGSSRNTATASATDAGAVVGAALAGAMIIGTVKWLLEPLQGGGSYPSDSSSSTTYSAGSGTKRPFTCSYVCRGSLFATGNRYSVQAFGADESSARESAKAAADQRCSNENRLKGGAWWADFSLCKEQ